MAKVQEEVREEVQEEAREEVREEVREEAPKIKHIVISGGGVTGFAFYGVLRESNKAGFWKMSDIQTIHATSIGTFIMTSLAIINVIGWDSADDFFVKRPWEQIVNLTADRILKSYGNVGVFSLEEFEQGLRPLLTAVDLSLNTTLLEFYEFSGVEMHWYTTNLDKYRLEDISYKTHPDWRVVDATYCSCALPIMFRPGNVNGVLYSDGGTFCGYPIAQCAAMADSPDEILGIYKPGIPIKHIEYANMLDYLTDIIKKTIKCLDQDIVAIKNEVRVADDAITLNQVSETFKTQESRSSKIRLGVDCWRKFITSRECSQLPH